MNTRSIIGAAARSRFMECLPRLRCAFLRVIVCLCVLLGIACDQDPYEAVYDRFGITMEEIAGKPAIPVSGSLDSSGKRQLLYRIAIVPINSLKGSRLPASLALEGAKEIVVGGHRLRKNDTIEDLRAYDNYLGKVVGLKFRAIYGTEAGFFVVFAIPPSQDASNDDLWIEVVDPKLRLERAIDR